MRHVFESHHETPLFWRKENKILMAEVFLASQKLCFSNQFLIEEVSKFEIQRLKMRILSWRKFRWVKLIYQQRYKKLGWFTWFHSFMKIVISSFSAFDKRYAQKFDYAYLYLKITWLVWVRARQKAKFFRACFPVQNSIIRVSGRVRKPGYESKNYTISGGIFRVYQ